MNDLDNISFKWWKKIYLPFLFLWLTMKVLWSEMVFSIKDYLKKRK